MSKSSANKALPQSQESERITKQIETCKKFIDLSSYSSITIIFSGKHKGFETTDLVKMDEPDFKIVPIKELFDFFNSYAANLTAKKLFLENGIEPGQVDTFISGIDALKQSIKKNFG